MATTTNFGWTTPDNTGYVKDGALAIRTLGNSIDTSLVDLKGGTTGQLLKKASNTDMDFEWGSGGKVLQVVTATTTTSTSVSSATFTDSTLTASITPTLATSKVMVFVSQQFYVNRPGGADCGGTVKIVRGSTDIYLPSTPLIFTANSDMMTIVSIAYLDSPATTSATTYKTQINAANPGGGGNVVAQRNSGPSVITLMEIGA